MQECKNECKNNFKNSIENCNGIFQNNKSNCTEDKNNALGNCRNTYGNNRANCVSNAIINFTNCNGNAINLHRACINSSSAKLRLCLASCEIEKPIIVLPGFDIFETSVPNSSLDINIPSSFFEPSSDPFSGRVEFKGEPIAPPVFGTADTIVERKAPANLSGPNFNDTIPIEIVALSLVSTNPITVTYNGNASSRLWNVRVVLSPSKASNGTMTIRRNNTQGGTFDSNFFVQPKFIFERLNDSAVKVLDTGNDSQLQPPYQLQANNSPWKFEPCHPEVLRVPNFTSNFCPSSTNLGRVLTNLTGLNAQHSIKPATEFYGQKFAGCRAPSPVPLLVFRPDFNRNLTPFSQFNRTAWGNQSCGPTSAGSILQYWNRTGFPSIMGNYSLPDLIERLRNLSGTTEENGTSVFNLVEAITKHLQNRSFAKNFTVTVFENDPGQADGTTTFKGKQNGVNVTAYVDNNFTFSDLTREMTNETVIILLQNASGDGHFVAANDYTRNANSDGSHNISIMDPALGEIINVVMRDNEMDFGTGNWTIVSVISVSPEKALLDSDSDGIPDIRETACSTNTDCNDQNSCTNDLCLNNFCSNQPLPNGAVCEDGFFCTVEDSCMNGACVATPRVCFGDQCHDPVCDEVFDNCPKPKSDGTPCDDFDACTEADFCIAEVCGGLQVDCNDNNQCTQDSCDFILGCDNSPLTGDPCDDGLFCTVSDECDNGNCLGQPRDCSDLDPCTIDICRESEDVCLNGPISECTSNDGCCPHGCNANNDNDCPAVCGNLIVEPGEDCDPPDEFQACPVDVFVVNELICGQDCTLVQCTPDGGVVLD